MNKTQALQEFFSSFGLMAFDENTVPDKIWDETLQREVEVKMPYITYDISIGNFGEDVYTSISVWYYSSSWTGVEDKVSEISEVLSNGGVNIPYDGGNIWIKKSNPFAQRIPDTNDMVRRYRLNVAIEYH